MAAMIGYPNVMMNTAAKLNTLRRPLRIAHAPFTTCFRRTATAAHRRQRLPAIRTYACSQHNGTQSSSQNFTITTPLYYVNAAPHMGSAYPTIAADVLSRYQRLQGKTVRFVTGTDEHGEKIALAAQKRGMTPKEHCDNIVQEYKGLWSELDIAYDSFIRTTDAKHEAVVRSILDQVWDSGDIYPAKYEGWYCVDCEEYKEEGDMDSEHNCQIHRKPCNFRSEENYFFRLSKWQQQIEELLEREDFVQPASRRNEVMGWVKEGVKDFSISRAAVQWGIPVPKDPKQTVYVWFDALNGYLSALLPEGQAPTAEALSAAGWPASMHVIGKDILRFHAVYWPGMLLSAGLPLPERVFGHGFLTKDGLKMGKSLGNTLDPVALVGGYGADAVRYFFMREVNFGADGNFSEQQFRESVNAGLANTLGNLLNRTLGLLNKNYSLVLPAAAADVPLDHPLRAAAAEKVAEAAAAFDQMQPHKGTEILISAANRGNQYLEETAPWTAFKKGSPEEKEAAGKVLVAVLELARVVSVAISPVVPSLSRRIYLQLGLSEQQFQELRWTDTQWGVLTAGHQTATPAPVFARIEADRPFVAEPAPQPVAAAAGGKK